MDVEERIAAALPEDEPPYESDDDDDEEEREAEELEVARREGGWCWRYRALLVRRALRRTGSYLATTLTAMIPRPRPTQLPPADRNRLSRISDSGEVHLRRFQAPKGKKIFVPIRVEPKVHFAAERTFLSWLEFSIFISSIAVALINFTINPNTTKKPVDHNDTKAPIPVVPGGDVSSSHYQSIDRGPLTSTEDTISHHPHHETTQPSHPLRLLIASAFTLVACLSLLYSLCLYLYRVDGLRNRRPSARYHDRYGPTVLCVAVFVAVGFNFAVGFFGTGYSPSHDIGNRPLGLDGGSGTLELR